MPTLRLKQWNIYSGNIGYGQQMPEPPVYLTPIANDNEQNIGVKQHNPEFSSKIIKK